MKKLVVYDDEERFGRNYARRLRAVKVIRDRFKVESMSTEKFKREMELLRERQKHFRGASNLKDSSDLDTVDILVIDYDLLKLDFKSFWTSDVAAYLARCYSHCGLLIGLNQFGQNPFDLTLSGHLESYADFNIGSDQLDNPRLWEGEANGFRPWYWPHALKYLETFDRRVEEVERNLVRPICQVIGLGDVVETFPRSVSEFLGPDPASTTFKDFVTKSGNGLSRKDKNLDSRLLARIAAARLSKWIERRLITGQDILVDAPHLVSRYPSLLRGDHDVVSTWNKSASFLKHSQLGLDSKKIEKFRFGKDHWVSRPVWFWGELSRSKNIKEVPQPWTRESPKFVFCEDSSRFHKREECKEFIAEVDSPYDHRYLKSFPKVNYMPKVRLVAS